VLENADELRTLATTLNELLSAEEGSVLSQLGAAQRPLSSIERIDPAAARMQELFDAGFYALQELARSVEDYAGSVELDPTRLEEVRRRRAVACDAGAKNDSGAGRSSSDAHLRRSRRRNWRASRSSGRRHSPSRRQGASGLRHLASPSDRRQSAPSHRGCQRRPWRRDD